MSGPTCSPLVSLGGLKSADQGIAPSRQHQKNTQLWEEGFQVSRESLKATMVSGLGHLAEQTKFSLLFDHKNILKSSWDAGVGDRVGDH